MDTISWPVLDDMYIYVLILLHSIVYESFKYTGLSV